MSEMTIGVLVAVAVLVVGILVFLWYRHRHKSSINDAFRAIAIERLEDVVIPDGMDGEIHVEHLLLTVQGVVVVNVKHYEGVVFAGDRLDQWSGMRPSGRTTFGNPLADLRARVAAVKSLASDIKVAGFVVFPAEADFSKGRPEQVMLPSDLVASYQKPPKDEIGRHVEAFSPQWDKIRQAVVR